MSKLYTLEELTESIINDFKLDRSGEDAFHRYYQKIYRTLNACGFLKIATKKTNPGTKRQCRYYTEQQKRAILAEKTLYDYVRKNSTSKRIKNSKKYSEIQIDIKRRRNEYFDMMNDLIDNPPDENTPYISNKEFQNYKNSMMLNALFEKFFTPIDDALLRSDMTQVFITRDEASLEISDIEVEQRLSHPQGIYYKPLDQ